MSERNVAGLFAQLLDELDDLPGDEPEFYVDVVTGDLVPIHARHRVEDR